jgi:hypothetical protein
MGASSSKGQTQLQPGLFPGGNVRRDGILFGVLNGGDILNGGLFEVR